MYDGASGKCVCNDGSIADETTRECPGKFTFTGNLFFNTSS